MLCCVWGVVPAPDGASHIIGYINLICSMSIKHTNVSLSASHGLRFMSLMLCSFIFPLFVYSFSTFTSSLDLTHR